MRQITHTIYQYDELTPEAQAKARDWYRDISDDSPFLSEYMQETADELLTKYGFREIVSSIPYYSLGYSQGDGAMIAFSAKFTYKRKKYDIEVRQNGHYNHERSTYLVIQNKDQELISEALEKEIEEAVLVPMFRELAKAGYSYIEAENEDDNVADNIRANEYEFYENGKRA